MITIWQADRLMILRLGGENRSDLDVPSCIAIRLTAKHNNDRDVIQIAQWRAGDAYGDLRNQWYWAVARDGAMWVNPYRAGIVLEASEFLAAPLPSKPFVF